MANQTLSNDQFNTMLELCKELATKFRGQQEQISLFQDQIDRLNEMLDAMNEQLIRHEKMFENLAKHDGKLN
jgi:hypothetical protein